MILYRHILVIPKLAVESEKLSKYSGELVSITCEVKAGDPLPKIPLFKSTNEQKVAIHSDERYSQNGSTLTLRDLRKEDEGTYICEATNDAGEDSKSVMLNVIGKFLLSRDKYRSIIGTDISPKHVLLNILF